MNIPLMRLWTKGLVRRQTGRLVVTIIGVGLAVSLLVTLSGFLAATLSGMTHQAIAGVPVDWQVQLSSSADPTAAATELARQPGAASVVQVGYFSTMGFQATTGNTVQTTGAGKVLGLGPGYRDAFPAEIRNLVGAGDVLLGQQLAANLHAAPGSVIAIGRPGLDTVQATVSGIVDLPYADSLFQTVGAPAGAAPTAPPDNVLLVPLAQWHTWFDPVTQTDPTAVTMQLHATIPHDLPASPTRAFSQVAGEARNYEIRLAGNGIVGDNLAARLDIARSDALYAQLLFLFLGFPGVMLAALLTAMFVASSGERRRRDQGLLRIRGASPANLMLVAIVEAVIVWLGAAVLGLAVGGLIVRLTFHRWSLGASPTATVGWAALSVLVGGLITLATLVIPAWRDLRGQTVSASVRSVRRAGTFWWERIGLDILLLVAAAVIYWRQARGGYQLILVPEGIPQVSVSYEAFLAPLLLWVSGGLLIVRLTRLVLAHRLVPAIRPLTANLGGLVTSILARQRGRTATGLVMIALAVAFATSTAIFNATYERQSRVDAELTNGSDVTVTGTTGSDFRASQAAVSSVPGVAAVEPMQHRFAYVGTDLQDLYGVRPATLTDAARLADSYFVGGTAKEVMGRLAATPDGVLVSPETVTDFQLQPGDTIRLRVQSAVDQQYHAVPFRYVGIAREFPTAPSDSFLVANADYIAQQTQSASVETLLVRTDRPPAGVADGIRNVLGVASGATVRDLQQAQQQVRTGLTAVSLHDLTRIELLFALLFAVGGAALMLFIGAGERRRTLAIMTSLGTGLWRGGAMVWTEMCLVLVGGIVGGGLLGWIVAQLLIRMLTGVFDPPPDTTVVPFAYLAAVVLLTIITAGLASLYVVVSSRRAVIPVIRGL